jgi:hypothetical protein
MGPPCTSSAFPCPVCVHLLAVGRAANCLRCFECRVFGGVALRGSATVQAELTKDIP